MNRPVIALGSLVAGLLAGCGTPTSPVPPSGLQPEICALVAPHQFSESLLTFLAERMDNPAVSADRDWIADVLKVRRCLCGEDRTECPE